MNTPHARPRFDASPLDDENARRARIGERLMDWANRNLDKPGGLERLEAFLDLLEDSA